MKNKYHKAIIASHRLSKLYKLYDYSLSDDGKFLTLVLKSLSPSLPDMEKRFGPRGGLDKLVFIKQTK